MSTTSGGSKDKMWKKGRDREREEREGGSQQAKAKSSNVDLSEPIMARRMYR